MSTGFVLSIHIYMIWKKFERFRTLNNSMPHQKMHLCEFCLYFIAGPLPLVSVSQKETGAPWELIVHTCRCLLPGVCSVQSPFLCEPVCRNVTPAFQDQRSAARVRGTPLQAQACTFSDFSEGMTNFTTWRPTWSRDIWKWGHVTSARVTLWLMFTAQASQ